MANASGRFFGWVMGSSLPAALAADWLVSAWDQNAGMRDATPGVVGVEEVAAAWLLQLLGLPSGAAVGFATGATMANFTCLAAARDRVLGRAGWDVAADGLSGAPRVRVLVGAEGHGSVVLALRYLGPRRCPSRSPSTSRGGWTPTTSRRRLDGRGRPGDRLPAGRQHPFRRLRSRWPRRSTSPIAPGRGCTWTAPSGSGPPSSRPWRR